MKFLLLVLSFTFSLSFVWSQKRDYGGEAATYRVYGKVLDSRNNKGADAVSIQLIGQNTNAATGLKKDTVYAGMFTRSNGEFDFNNVPLSNNVTLVVTAIGFKKIEKLVSLKPTNSMLQGQREFDLGNFSIEPEAQVLQNVTVTAIKPIMEMGVDRRIFNVDKNITATGGTAVDVMKNIPSVTVDVDGNVKLRNSTPQLFIDGRPTILTLEQIPADNIEKVELITNPSAKFNASSSGGIINVVLKKNKRIGLNGNASVSVGTPKITAGGVSLNIRDGKFNFFVSGNINRSGGVARTQTYRQNKLNGQFNDFFTQNSATERIRNFQSVRFGTDYFIDNRNTLTFSQNIVSGRFSSTEEQNQEYRAKNGTLERTGIRFSDGNFGFDRSGTQLIFSHKFAKTGQVLSADVNYNGGKGNNNSNIINNFYLPDGSLFSPQNRVLNLGKSNENQLTIQVDYENPIGDNAKIETGVRTYVSNNNSIFNAFSLAANNDQTKLPLSNNYQTREVINAAYITYSNKIKTITYQAGLRAETSSFDGLLVDQNQDFGYKYPDKLKNIWDALFPSLFITKTLTEKVDLQLNYSRRIQRPNFWQINPFVDIQDPLNIRQGNPGLRPEFTNSFEVNYNKNYPTGNLFVSLFYRNTTNDITQYTDTISSIQFQQLNNAAIAPNAVLNTFINAKSQNRMGLDVTWQQKIGKNLEIIPNVNLQYRKVRATFKNIDLSNQGFNWESKLIINYKLIQPKPAILKDLSFQLIGEYESPEVIPQGRNKPQYGIDFAVRKDILKNKKGTITFGIDDVFNTKRWGSIIETENFYQDSFRRYRVRSFRLTFSYKFGDPNFSIFKKRSHGSDRSSDEGG